jgi:DMSO/TMAO reductase YedYZ molybdopterin-dependent catalytic subunit
MSPRDVVTGRLRRWLRLAALAFVIGLAGLGGSYLAVGRVPSWVVTPFDAFVLAASPDALVQVAITEFGTLGHQLAFLAAILLAGVVLGVTALPAVFALEAGRRLSVIVFAAALPGLAAFAVTTSAVSALGTAGGTAVVGVVLVAVAFRSRDRDASHSPARRQVLGAVGAALGVAGAGALLRRGAPSSEPTDHVAVPDDGRPAVRDLLTTARERSLDVDGLEPLVSTNFYEVDINNVDPTVDADEWELSITGAVESETTVSFADLESMPFEDRFVSLRCVGDGVNGTQLDNALWGGVPVSHLLDLAGPTGEYVVLRAADGYYNEFPIDALRPGLLAFRMNGRPLPRGHGAPVRALVPGHWGEVNVKWLTEIEVSDEPVTGYWEKRGWHGTGPVTTVAKLWQTNYVGPDRVELAGHAYAGTRGVRRVEVSIDGGETWAEATLSDPLPGDDVWRQWRYAYETSARHEAVVRAVDDTGAVQPREPSGAYPSGASGWVSQQIVPK